MKTYKFFLGAQYVQSCRAHVDGWRSKSL